MFLETGTSHTVQVRRMTRRLQAKDISDERFALALAATANPWGTSTWPAMTENLGMPSKVVLAKARNWYKRGLLNHDVSCVCGCIGNWMP